MVSSRDRIRQAKIGSEAEGYLELGLADNALAALARLGEPAEFDPHSLLLWGEALRMLDRYHEAIAPLELAAERMPDNLHVRFALAWCFKRIGKINLAIDSLETVLVAEPEEPLAHYNLACYWSLAGDRSRALEYLAQALSIDGDYRELIDGEPDFDPIRGDPAFEALRSPRQPAN